MVISDAENYILSVKLAPPIWEHNLEEKHKILTGVAFDRS